MKRRILILGALASVTGCAGPFSEGMDPELRGGPDESHVPKARTVAFPGHRAHEIHVIPEDYALYWTLPGGQARKYLVGIGRPGQYISGTYHVGDKRKWPSWTPTPAMIRREPEIYKPHAAGMPGGPGNPLGARAMYLYRANGTDTYLRIHGTHDPRGLGQQISNGCVQMANSQVIELYDQVRIGTRVVLHPM